MLCEYQLQETRQGGASSTSVKVAEEQVRGEGRGKRKRSERVQPNKPFRGDPSKGPATDNQGVLESNPTHNSQDSQ